MSNDIAEIIRWASREALYNGAGNVINPEIFEEAANKIGALAFARFHNALRILRSIDHAELIEANAYPGLTGEQIEKEWASFRDHPYRYFIACEDETAQAIWRIIEGRQP
jgi:hypothetical protein